MPDGNYKYHILITSTVYYQIVGADGIIGSEGHISMKTKLKPDYVFLRIFI